MQITVKELYDQLGPHWENLPVVFTTGDEPAPGGYPEWHDCRVRYNDDLKALEIIVRDQRAP